MSLKSTKDGVVVKQEPLDLLRRAAKPNSEWPDNDDLLDVVYWLKQLTGAVIGLLWGIIPLHGFVGLVLFCVLNTVALHYYVTVFQGFDVELLGGSFELAKEGFMTSFATFLVAWIITYSALHSTY